MRAPWIKFYPGDWLRSAELRVASLEARGLWIEILCHMHESLPRGFLVIGGRAPTVDQIARMVGADVARTAELLDELESLGVLSKDETGMIYNRRMAREGEISDFRSIAGKQGGNARVQANRKQNSSKRSSKAQANVKQNFSGCSSKPSSKPLASSFYVSSLEETSVRPLPEILDTDEFRIALDAWIAMRAEIRKPVKPTGLAAQIQKLEAMAQELRLPATIEAVRDSTANQWQGIFKPDPKRQSSKNLFGGIEQAVEEFERKEAQ